MIRARTLYEILMDRSGTPWTAAEERLVDRHIAAECAQDPGRLVGN